MKKIFVFAALLTAALAVSCNKEIAIETSPAKKMVTFNCVFPDGGTKVSIDGAGKTAWEVGDEIHIHTGHIKDGEYTTVTLTADDISVDGKTAKITFEELKPYDFSSWGDGYATYYAAYPAAATNNPGSCYCRNYFGDTNNFLMAACDDGAGSFHFYNLCGIISFEVESGYDSYVFSGNADEVVGYETYAVEILGGSQKFNYEKGTSGSKKMITGDVVSGVNYICLPNGADFSAGFNIKFKKNGEIVKVANTNTPVDVARNKYLNLGDITSKLENYSAPSTSDHKSAITGATDISTSGTANCYVIYEPGAYKFPAVKGNSATEAGNVFGVELMWETYNNAEEVTANTVIEAVDFENNWIYFKVPSPVHAGNAVIAAKNSEDQIIWSWHIWVPATTIAPSTYNLMDRNLGALTAPVVGTMDVTTLGLAYQWGRKDPFPGPKNTDEETAGATVAGTAISVVHSGTEAPGSLALSIQNPTVLYTANNLDWSSSENSTLWKDGDDKTIYDPCPVGYRVPAAADCPVLFATDPSTSEGWEKDETNLLFKIGNPSLVFPLGGYLDDYFSDFKFCKIGLRLALWTSEAASASKGSVLDIRFDKGTQALGSTPKSRAAYVRCIAEK